MDEMMKKGVLLIPVVFVAAFIFYNSAQPADISGEMSGNLINWLQNTFGISVSQFAIRKLAHFSEFALLGFLTFALIKWKSVLVCGLYAATDEIHQCFVLGRSCEFRDWCIDFCGVMFGVLIMWLILKLGNRAKEQKAKNQN